MQIRDRAGAVLKEGLAADMWGNVTDSAQVDYTFETSGTFTVVVDDWNGWSGTGDYALYWQRWNSPLNTTPLTYIQPVSGKRTQLMQLDLYSLTANAGDYLILRLKRTSGDFGALVQLRSLAGAVLKEGTATDMWGNVGDSVQIEYSFNASGAYIVVVDEWTGWARTGEYVLAAQNVACGFSVSPASQSFPASGGTGSISVVAAPSACAWIASSDSPFITLTPPVTGAGSGKVDYTVAASTFDTGRSGNISVSGQTVAITQSGAAKNAWLVSPPKLAFSLAAGPAAADSSRLTVDSPSPLAWTAAASTTDGKNWLSAQPASGSTTGFIQAQVNAAALSEGAYHGKITVQVPGGATTSADVPVDLTVTAPAAPQLAVEPAGLVFESDRGGSRKPLPCAWAIPVAER